MSQATRIVTKAELAREADAAAGEIDELVAAGILRPDPGGDFGAFDVPRVRLAHALREGGISPDDLRWAIDTRRIPIDRVAEMSTPPSRSDHTFGELVAALGDRGQQLPSVYAAFGIAVPPPEAAIPVDEEQLLRRFFDFWAMVDDTPEVALRAAHIAGDGMRRISAATLDLFDEHGGPPPERLKRGLTDDEAMQPSFLLPVLQRDLLEWLKERHTEHEVFERIVGFMERSLAEAGRAQPRSIDLPAIAFVDLAGYTELTVASGDERAAEFATLLHVVASRVVADHGGRVVKQLGDGVLIRFRSGADAIAGVRAVVAAIVDAGLPAAHAGIAVGRFVVRDGDVYGNVVNLASRIAALAQAGDVLLPIEDASELLPPGGWDEVGEATLKGITDPIGLARVHLQGDS